MLGELVEYVTVVNDPTGSDSDGPREAQVVNFDFRDREGDSDEDSVNDMSVEVRSVDNCFFIYKCILFEESKG